MISLLAAFSLVAAAAGALPSPTCALNGNPCPIPQGWELSATWNLTRSTTIQPGGASYFLPKHPWGLISLDWSVASSVWFLGNTSNTTCEATSINGCKMLKEKGLAQKCFIYHNMELGLQWLESQRAVMYDPATAGYFLHVGGNPTAAIYNEPISFGDQFFWDFRNPEAAKYFVSSIAKLLEDPSVDGTFTDDVTGVPAEHPLAPAKTGLSAPDVEDLQYATGVASQTLIEVLAAQGKGNWQAFGGQDGTGALISRSGCRLFMRMYCLPQYQGRVMMMQMDTSAANKAQTLAAFLIVRPPVGYIGWGWESDDTKWDDIFFMQVGVPKGLCEETSEGVFSRAYTEGTASLDCNAWNASLPFKSL